MGIFDRFWKKKINKGKEKILFKEFIKAHSSSQWGEVIKYGEELVEISKNTGNRAGESACYANLGIAYGNLGEFRKGIESFEKALKIAKEISDRALEARCYNSLGLIYGNLREIKKAIEYHKKALKIAKEIGDKAFESICHNSMDLTYEKMRDDGGKKENLINAFKKAFLNSQWREVIEHGVEVAKIFRDIGAKEGESGCYFSLGTAYRNLENFNKAIESYEKSMRIAKEIGDKEGESSCYASLGMAYANLGDFNKEIRFFEKSLEIEKEIGDVRGESACYTSLGNVHHSLGDFKKAIEFYEKSLKIAEEIGDKVGEFQCYGNLGHAYNDLGRFKKAIEFHEKSLKIAEEIGDRADKSKCYNGLGNAYYSSGDFKKAIEFYEKSLEIDKGVGSGAGESLCYLNLGNIYLTLGNFKKAIEFYEKSLEISKDICDNANVSTCYGNLGLIYYHNKKDYPKSLDYAKRSIKLTEQVRESSTKEELSLSFLKTKINTYDLAINSAINLYKKTNDGSYLKDVVEIIERTKSRELMKIIKAKKKDPKAEEEYKELEDVEVKIAELEAKIKSALEEKRSIEREVEEKNGLYKRKLEIYKRIREKSLDPSSIVPSIDENIIKGFWEVFEGNADNCTVLEIYEQEKRIMYILFDKEKLEFFEKEIAEEKIKELVNPLESMRSSPIFADTFYGFLKHVLNSILPEILKERLGNLKTEELFIIPHKHLHQIPWEAVVVDKRPLCVKYNLIRHYSLDLIRSSLKYEEKENKNALLVSNPKPSKMDDLPGAEIECNAINEVLTELPYNPTHLSREFAKIEDVENQLPNISIVHFSCHGLFNLKDPFESSIALSSDKKLSANRISLKNLDYYPIVFLNACETGITKSYELTAGVGDEQIGLVRAFAMAHSPSIIVTGWEIDVDVAKYFGKTFYSAISDNNLISALRFAREKTYNKFKDESKDWAAYVLYGNPYRRL